MLNVNIIILLLCDLDQVVTDMKRMKEEHIDLVERMQGAYREIEEESKVRESLKIPTKSGIINCQSCNNYYLIHA